MHVIIMSYVSTAIEELDAEAKKTGIDHLNVVKTSGEVHTKGGKVRKPALTCDSR
jgi:hypothetical protein